MQSKTRLTSTGHRKRPALGVAGRRNTPEGLHRSCRCNPSLNPSLVWSAGPRGEPGERKAPARAFAHAPCCFSQPSGKGQCRLPATDREMPFGEFPCSRPRRAGAQLLFHQALRQSLGGGCSCDPISPSIHEAGFQRAHCGNVLEGKSLDTSSCLNRAQMGQML